MLLPANDGEVAHECVSRKRRITSHGAGMIAEGEMQLSGGRPMRHVDSPRPSTREPEMRGGSSVPRTDATICRSRIHVSSPATTPSTSPVATSNRRSTCPTVGRRAPNSCLKRSSTARCQTVATGQGREIRLAWETVPPGPVSAVDGGIESCVTRVRPVAIGGRMIATISIGADFALRAEVKCCVALAHLRARLSRAAPGR